VITYVDTSTLIKLVIDEDGSDRAELIWQSADSLASASLVRVEAHAALAAATRDGRLTTNQFESSKEALVELVNELYVVEVTGELIEDAAELAEVEALRGYDAVHLASALRVGSTVFTSSDAALCEAAERRDMHVAL